MTYFSIGLEMAVTIYIQAKSLTEAQGKLARVLSKSIDVHDYRWFSDASFGSPNLPEISFSTGMELRGPAAGEVLQVIDGSEMRRLTLSSPEATKSKVVPGSKDRFGNGVTPIYCADLRAKVAGIIKFESEGEALALLANMQAVQPPVHWEYADDWFELEGLENEEYPLILSPNIQILEEFHEVPLSLRWSSEDDENSGLDDNANEDEVARVNDSVANNLQVLVASLRTQFASYGGRFESISDDDLQAIGVFLMDNREVGFHT